jgi:hypothetical protein
VRSGSVQLRSGTRTSPLSPGLVWLPRATLAAALGSEVARGRSLTARAGEQGPLEWPPDALAEREPESVASRS